MPQDAPAIRHIPNHSRTKIENAGARPGPQGRARRKAPARPRSSRRAILSWGESL